MDQPLLFLSVRASQSEVGQSVAVTNFTAFVLASTVFVHLFLVVGFICCLFVHVVQRLPLDVAADVPDTRPSVEDLRAG